jgi:hypothetical protein
MKLRPELTDRFQECPVPSIKLSRVFHVGFYAAEFTVAFLSPLPRAFVRLLVDR